MNPTTMFSLPPSPTCAINGCTEPLAKNSKYCKAHKREAHARWLDKVKAGAEERKASHAVYAEAVKVAHEAGLAAVAKCQVEPMTVLTGDGQHVVDVVPDGVCGFAWVTVKRNRRFYNWALQHGWSKSHSHGGCYIWVSMFNQSMTKKEVYAQAFASELRLRGIAAYADSRMD